jgi:hypothetical protein
VARIDAAARAATYTQPSAAARSTPARGRDIAAHRNDLLEVKRADTHMPLRTVEFGFYSGASIIIHAFIAIPAVIARFITDILLGYTMFEAVKPKKRADLY